MSSVNTAAIFSEFSFLSRHVKRKDIQDAKVERFDIEALEIRPKGTDESCVLLIDKKGGVVTRVRSDKSDPSIWDIITQPFMPWTWQGHLDRNVGDALKRLKARARDVVFVVQIQREHLTFYKPPKGCDGVGTWFLSLVEQKCREFSAQ